MREQSLLPLFSITANRLGLGTKAGYAYSPQFGVQKTVLAEVYEKNGWSLDLGLTKGHVLAGVSKDIYKDILDVNIGVSANIKKEKSFYTGFSIRF